MPIRTDRPRLTLIATVMLVAALAAVANDRWSASRRGARAAARATDGALVVAATGDSAIVSSLASRQADLRPIGALLHGASVAITNFELTLLSTAAPPADDLAPRWPSAAPDAATTLRALGFTAVSLANNHIGDYGIDGLEQTGRQLDLAGLAHAGTGPDLAQARAGVTIDTGAGRVAFVDAATSHASGARAAPRRGEINGRPGLSAIRYTRRVTVDGPTYATLQRTMAGVAAAGAGSIGADGTLTLFRMTVHRGERNVVDLVADPDDVAGVADAIRQARRDATVVVFSLHAHEPGNLKDAVDGLLRSVAHAAIDAGADMVVGHGPHRLRGIEIYRDRPILYSLGNFIFQDAGLQAGAADVFEDLTQDLVAGATHASDGTGGVLDYQAEVWWESVVALARFEHGRFAGLALHPIDLGIGQPRETRGVPRLAGPDAARRILARLQQLSAPLGTTIEIRDTIGVIRPPAPTRPSSASPTGTP